VVSGFPNITPIFMRDEDHRRVRLGDRPRELPQRLAHQPRLEPDVVVAHLALDLGPRHQRRHGVHDHEVDGARAQQHVDDLEGLLAGVGLRDEQVLHPDPQPAGVPDVEGVLGVDEGGDAAGLLHLGHGVKRQGRLAARLRPVDLDDPPARVAADAQRQVEARRAAGEGLHLPIDAVFGHREDRALPELLLDGGNRQGDRLLLVGLGRRRPVASVLRIAGHDLSPPMDSLKG
jgi:hypothetical protein